MIVMQLNKNELEMRAWSSCFGFWVMDFPPSPCSFLFVFSVVYCNSNARECFYAIPKNYALIHEN